MKIRTFPYGLLGGNCYLCTDDLETEGVLIDPDTPPSVVLKDSNKSLKIYFILITHFLSGNLCNNFDHMLSYKDWQDFANIPSAAMAEETEGLLSPSVNLNEMFYSEQIIYGAPEIQLKDNQILSFGNHTIKVIATPGHTVGSCCYLIDDALFSGDTVFALGNYGRFDFPTGDASITYTKFFGKLLLCHIVFSTLFRDEFSYIFLSHHKNVLLFKLKLSRNKTFEHDTD